MQSKIRFPLSVITGPAFFTPSRSTHSAPSFSKALITGTRASAIISTGRAKPVPRLFTSFEESATIAKFDDAKDNTTLAVGDQGYVFLKFTNTKNEEIDASDVSA